MTEHDDVLPVGSRVQAFSPNEPWHGRLGTVEEGPERRDLGFEYEYLIRLDRPLEHGARLLVVNRHELRPA